MIRRTLPWTISLIVMAATGTAHAQPSERATRFFTIYGGAQPQRHDLVAEQTFPLFDETATVTSNQRIRNGGVFKAAVGFPVRGRLGVGGGVSVFGRPGTASVQALLPSPSFFGRMTRQDFTASDLKHREVGVHASLLYQMPITREVGLTFSIGPSLVRVKQDLATVSVSSAGQASVIKSAESGNAFCVNGGLDAVYRVTPALGLGLFVHYVGGKVDLPSASGLSVGGVQGGLAFRVNF